MARAAWVFTVDGLTKIRRPVQAGDEPQGPGGAGPAEGIVQHGREPARAGQLQRLPDRLRGAAMTAAGVGDQEEQRDPGRAAAVGSGHGPHHAGGRARRRHPGDDPGLRRRLTTARPGISVGALDKLICAVTLAREAP
jgi:hypothetical protein